MSKLTLKICAEIMINKEAIVKWNLKLFTALRGQCSF